MVFVRGSITPMDIYLLCYIYTNCYTLHIWYYLLLRGVGRIPRNLLLVTSSDNVPLSYNDITLGFQPVPRSSQPMPWSSQHVPWGSKPVPWSFESVPPSWKSSMWRTVIHNENSLSICLSFESLCENAVHRSRSKFRSA